MSNHFKNVQQTKDLLTIPGVSESMAKDFLDINIHEVNELKNQDPEKLYQQMCEKQEVDLDRNILYVIRCAVYFASTKHPDPEKLNWWNWKDSK